MRNLRTKRGLLFLAGVLALGLVALAWALGAGSSEAQQGALQSCPQPGGWAIAVWDGDDGTDAEQTFATCGEGAVAAAYSIDPDTQVWWRWFADRPDVSNLETLDNMQGVVALGGAGAPASASASSSPQGDAMQNCPLQGKWAISVWSGDDATDAEQAFATCGEGAVAAAYSIHPETQGWSRYFAGRPEVSNLQTLNNMQGVIVLGGIGAPAPSRVEASAAIGPAGGTIEVTDPSSHLYGVRVEIAEGALDETVILQISKVSSLPPLPANITPISPVVGLGPDGTRFSSPVTVRLRYDAADVNPNDVVLPLIYSDSESRWYVAMVADIDQPAGTIDILTTHFSSVVTATLDPLTGPNPAECNTGFSPSRNGFPVDSEGWCAGIAAFSQWFYANHGDCAPLSSLDHETARQIAKEAQQVVEKPPSPLLWCKVDFRRRFPWEVFLDVLQREMAETGLPVIVATKDCKTGSEHAALAYKYDGETVFVYDPNHSGEQFTLTAERYTKGDVDYWVMHASEVYEEADLERLFAQYQESLCVPCRVDDTTLVAGNCVDETDNLLWAYVPMGEDMTITPGNSLCGANFKWSRKASESCMFSVIDARIVGGEETKTCGGAATMDAVVSVTFSYHLEFLKVHERGYGNAIAQISIYSRGQRLLDHHDVFRVEMEDKPGLHTRDRTITKDFHVTFGSGDQFLVSWLASASGWGRAEATVAVERVSFTWIK